MVSIIKYILSKGTILCLKHSSRTSREMNRWYPMYVYKLFTRDLIRNNAYRKVIRKLVKDKVVVEVGTGPFAFLANMCIDAGVKKVYAIEENEKAYAYAVNKIRKNGLQGKIQLLHGNSTEVTLEKKCDVLLHEIVGNIASAEGMVPVVNDAKMRFLKSDPIFIPYACSTFICPVSPLKFPLMDRMISSLGGGCFSISKPGFYNVFNFPEPNVLDKPQEAEHIIFQDTIQLKEKRDIQFKISRRCQLSGFLLYLKLFVDPHTVVDSLHQKTSWLTPYIKMFKSPIELNQGDIIHVRFTKDISTLNPTYGIKVRVCISKTKKEYNKKYSWTGT